MKDRNKTISFSKNRKDIANFLGSDNLVLSSDIKLYKQLYDKDYPYPVKISIYKELSVIFVLAALGLQVLSPLFKEYFSIAFGAGIIAVLLVSFGFVRKVKYPNEQYSILSLLIALIIGTSLLTLSIFNKESLVSNWFYLNILFNKGKIDTDIYSKINNSSVIFFYISCGLSFASMIFGTLVGRRRLESIMAPIISIVGFLLFCFISNYALDINFLNSIYNPSEGVNKLFLFYLIMVGASLALVAFDFVLIIIVRLIGGKKPRERR